MTHPSDWPLTRFGDIADFRNGLNFLSSESGSVVPMLGVADFKDRESIGADYEFAPVTPARELSSDDFLEPGDLVFVRSNGSKSLVGRCLIYTGPGMSAAISGFTIRARIACDSVDPNYLSKVMQSSLFRAHLLEQGGGSSINNLSQAALAAFKFHLPPLPEQRKIAGILRIWDDAIDKTLELRRLADARRAEFAERMLAPSHGVRRKLSELTSPIKTRNTAAVLGRESVMGVSNRSGLVPMREQTIAADISRYQILPPRAFAYNPMRINVGSIAMSRSKSDVLVSPDYVLFQCDERELRPEYLDHVLTTRWWLHHVNAGASGSVRTRTYYDDLAAISIAAPPAVEQDNVSRALDGLSNEIDLLQRKAELLRTQKRGLMQKLLTGQVRVSVAADVDPGGPEND